MEGAIHSVRGTDHGVLEQTSSHWGRMAKPLNSLGVLEKDIVRTTGVLESRHISVDRKAIMVMCAGNGIVEEGVTQTGQGVTAVVAGNMGEGCSCVCLMAERVGAKVIPVDVGMSCCGGIPRVIPGKVSMGTKNFLREPTMSREQTMMAVGAGIRVAEGLKNRECNLAGSGEMGIGNTTTSNVVLSILLDQDPGQVTGRGASLTTEGYKRGIRVTEGGIVLHRLDRKDPVNVLSKVEGLDLATLAGFYIGYGVVGLPMVIDGLIIGATALAAMSICPPVKNYLLASHISTGPARTMMLKALGLKPAIQTGMCLRGGTGTAALFPLLDMAAVVYDRMSSFEEIHVGQCEHLK